MGTEAKTKGDVRHLDHFVVAVMDAVFIGYFLFHFA